MIEQPVLRVEEPLEDRRRRDGRGDVREVVDRPIDRASADLLEQDIGDDQTERDLHRDGDGGVGECRRDRPPERLRARAEEDVGVVVDPAERSLDDVPLEEADVHRDHRGIDLEEEQDREGGKQEEIRLEILDKDTSAA